jgi:hypothetical protein
MRRLPSPAFCRLSDGDQTLEALYELFRDWQRTQTQSSVTALRSSRLQMDARFCMGRTHQPERHRCARKDPIRPNARSPERARRPRAFLLTLTYMDVGNAEVSPHSREDCRPRERGSAPG